MDDRCIEIPTADSAEVVEVYVDELTSQEEAAGVCELIASEEAPASLYLRLATLSPDRVLPWILEAAVADCRLRAPAVAAALLGMQAMRILHDHHDQAMTITSRIEQATMLLNQAERLDSQSTDLWARKGLLLLFVADQQRPPQSSHSIEAAQLQFKAVLERDGASVVARVGMALSAYQRGDHKLAVELFDALLGSGSSGTSVSSINEWKRDAHLAYAASLSQLLPHRFHDAVKQYRLLLSQNPKNALAIKGLGVLLTSPHGGLAVGGLEAVTEGLQLLKVYYQEHNRHDPVVCLILADHFFHKSDMAKAATLATTALSAITTMDNSNLKAKATYLLAKISHQQGAMDDAFTRYLQVIKLEPSHRGGLYGLAQLYVYRNDVSSALKTLEQLLTTNTSSSSTSVKSLMGCLLVQRYGETGGGDAGLLEKAWECLVDLPDTVLDCQPIVKLALATVLETRDPKRALSLYCDLLKDHRSMLTDARLVNMALLAMHLGDYQTASQYLNTVTVDSAPPLHDDTVSLCRIICSAECRSTTGTDDDTSVDDQLKQINNRAAMLYLCHRRLLRRHHNSAAMDLFKELLGNDDKDVEAWYGMAVCHLRQRAFTPARKAFERILANHDRHDIPALCGLAVVYCESARLPGVEKDQRQSMLKRSLEFAGKALTLQPRCLVAANTAAVALCELGMVFVCKDVFQSLSGEHRDRLHGTKFAIDIYTNTGIVLTECGAYEEARQALQRAHNVTLDDDDDNDDSSRVLYSRHRTMLYMLQARASYAQGKQTGDKRHFMLALEYLDKALDNISDDQSGDNDSGVQIRFDGALCRQEAALALMKTAAGVAPSQAVDMLEEAVQLIDGAMVDYDNSLCGTSDSDHTNVDAKTITQRRQYAVSLRDMLTRRCQDARDRDHQRTQQLRQVQLERQRREQQHQEQEREQAERRAADLQRIEEERRVLQATIAISATVGSGGASTPGDGEGDQTASPSRKTTRKTTTMGQGKRKKVDIGEQSDGSPTKRKQLSKDYISSDDDDLVEGAASATTTSTNNNDDDDDTMDDLDALFE